MVAGPAVTAGRSASVLGVRRLPLIGVALTAIVALAGCGAMEGESSRAPVSISARDCPSGLGAGWRCSVVDVPLDRSGRIGGRVHLAVALRHAPGAPRPAVLAIAGGPGSAAISAAPAFAARLAPLLAGRDLLVVDPRGTGASDPISCPGIDSASTWGPEQVATCARLLGPAAARYSTHDNVRDLEDVRRALRIPRLVVYGVSYGTKTALDLSRLVPRRVEALVLDSPIVDDTDPFYRRSARGSERVLRNVCAQGACPRGADPVRDLRAVVRRMHDGKLPGAAATLTEGALLHAVVSGGQNLWRLPSALHAAAAGRLGELASVLPAAIPDARDPDWLKPAFSRTVYLATSCDDGDFPWSRDEGLQKRRQGARAYIDRLPDADFGPFDRHVSEQYGETRICSAWPAARHHRPRRPVPHVPALLLVGGDDDLAPLEGAREVAAQLGAPRVVVVPGVGHGVLGVAPQGSAALAAFARKLG